MVVVSIGNITNENHLNLIMCVHKHTFTQTHTPTHTHTHTNALSHSHSDTHTLTHCIYPHTEAPGAPKNMKSRSCKRLCKTGCQSYHKVESGNAGKSRINRKVRVYNLNAKESQVE